MVASDFFYRVEPNFFLRKDIDDCLTTEARSAFFASMQERRFTAGTRMITRGTKGDRLFIIQDGICSVIIDKDGTDYPIVKLEQGDLAGEMALITGEPRSAHVDAETDVIAMEMKREEFDAICEKHPSLREILTKIVQENIFSSIFKEDREVGKYNIQEIIRQGEMSTDYKGIHRYIKIPVVIKVLRNDIAMDPEFFEQFKKDAMLIVQLTHDHIVTVYDIAGLYRTIFIFREFLEGELLGAYMDNVPNRKLPSSTSIDLLRQICSGLAYSHEKGLIHKGLNPNNIFVLPNKQVKILDFGLVFPKRSIGISLGERVAYMPPEQLSGKPLDERSDIYSLGMVAWEMVTGQRPFADVDVKTLLQSHAEQEIPDIKSMCPDLPDNFSQLISKATKKNPDDRYPSMQDMLHGLDNLVES
jgi:serine/threonine protein kinase